MNISTALKHAIDGNALLFLGSGFSVGATPLKGDKFLTGRQLADYLSKECNLAPPTDDLSFASQRYRKVFSDEKLVLELQDLFTVNNVTNNHRRFAEIQWKAIFTTNYDNVLERAFIEKKKRLQAVTLSNLISKNLPPNLFFYAKGWRILPMSESNPNPVGGVSCP